MKVSPTTNVKIKNNTLVITTTELESGKLIVNSQAKVDKIISVEQSLIGRIKKPVHEDLKKILLKIID